VERQLASIVESSDDAIISETLDGIITTWNRGAERIFGYTAEEMVGQPITRLAPDKRADEIPPMLARLANKEYIEHFETERLAKDGRLVDVSLSISPIVDGNGTVVGASKVARDITNQKRARDALEASEARYRALVETQAELICRFRLEGTILFANEAYARALGKTADELVGKDFWQFLPVHEHDSVRRQLSRLCPEAPEVQVENRISTRAGLQWMLWTNRAITFDAGGKVVEAQATGVDISDRKRIEEHLKDADLRKNEFLAVLGHELRNPLAPLRTGIELIERNPSDTALVESVREMMSRQLDHLQRLVDDLLDVARVSRGEIELKREPIYLADVVHAAVELARSTIDERRHDLRIRLAAHPVIVNGDFHRLCQVLSNLLQNSAKYTEPGGTIEIDLEADTNSAQVRVRDNGLGFVSDSQEMLFEMFMRIPEHRRSSGGGGLGVGLALSRRLVRLHGGDISARSAGLNKGSEFVVSLPTVIGAVGGDIGHRTITSQSPVRNRLGGRARRILVVDDNQDITESMQLLLTAHGHVVMCCNDGRQVLRYVRDFEPDVVLLDIGLPYTDGYSIAREIRGLGTAGPSLLCAVTGWGQDSDKHDAQQAGFDHHLTKPVDAQSLLALINF
jgi:PAS domain S-box-containing protein